MSSPVAVVGTGLVGGGWAIVFARAGHEVRLHDQAAGVAGQARAEIAARLDDLRDAGLLDEPPAAVLARIRVADTLAEATAGAAYVQESVFERVEAKRVLMSALDAVLGPDTLVGSSSSGIAASRFTEHVACRARCLVAHPVNPPYLAPIVELVPAPWTAPEALAAVRALMAAVGQVPVTLAREAEGFVLNRLQGVLLMEAWRLAESGLASVADIDRTVSDGLGLRWAFMGPFETIDLNAPGGVADYAHRLGGLYRDIAASTAEHRAWDDAVIATGEAQRRAALPADGLAARRAWRDRRLLALARHKHEMDRIDAQRPPDAPP